MKLSKIGGGRITARPHDGLRYNNDTAKVGIYRKLSVTLQEKLRIMADYIFYKNNENDTIWWVDSIGFKGDFLFSFDKKVVFNLFADYPRKLTAEQKATFDKENPYWADFFKDRL